MPTPLTRAEEKRIMDKITASRAEAIGLEAGDQVIFQTPDTLETNHEAHDESVKGEKFRPDSH